MQQPFVVQRVVFTLHFRNKTYRFFLSQPSLFKMQSMKRKQLVQTKSRKKVKQKSSLEPFWNWRSSSISNRLPSEHQSEPTNLDLSWTCNKLSDMQQRDNRISTTPLLVNENVDLLKAVRIRVYPTKEQKKLLNTWFGAARWTFNHCADYINKNMKTVTRKDLQLQVLRNDNVNIQMNAWVVSTPAQIRGGALIDAINALKAHKAKKKENQKGGFHLKFRCRNDPTQSIVVPKQDWGRKRGLFAPIFSASTLKSYDKTYPLPEVLAHDCRLLRDKNKKYFFCMPMDRARHDMTQTGKIVAIDPGVRTFLTTYDQDGEISEWGKDDRSRLYRLGIHIDKLTSKSTKVKHASRYRIKKAIGRIYDRIRNLVDDVHKKAAKWLCEHHQTILIPAFESHKMSKREGRRIHKSTVRSMLTWAHYRFRQRLIFKATEYPGVEVKIVTEEYTSKTCGKCGVLHHKLGGNKLFICPSCHWKCGRDVNGARNILIKHLTTTSSDDERMRHVALSLLPTDKDMQNCAKRAKLEIV